MVQTMTTTTTSTVTESPTTTTNNNSLDYGQKTQKAIVAGLLKQQPVIEKVSGSPPPVSVPEDTTMAAMLKMQQMTGLDINSILNTIHALTKQNATALAQISPLSGPLPTVSPLPMVLKVPKEEEPSSSTSPCSSATPIVPIESIVPEKPIKTEKSVEPPSEYKGRNVREKVYADGYIMSFDKMSCCGLKEFWRCEKKNNCNARMHSCSNTREILRKLHPHNHEKTPPEELAFYEQDFASMRPHFVYRVKSINRSYMNRKLSQAAHTVTHAPLTQQAEMESKPIPSPNLMLQAAAEAMVPVQFPVPQLPVQIGKKRTYSQTNSPVKIKLPKNIKNKDPDSNDLMSKEEFQQTFELTKQIMKIMQPKPEIGVTWQGDQDSLLLFLSNDNGTEENVFSPMVVVKKDLASLITALEGFTGKKCEGHLAMTYSQKVNIQVHEALIGNWRHGKLFLLDTSTPTLWRLTPVDAYGRILNSM